MLKKPSSGVVAPLRGSVCGLAGRPI